MGSFEVDLMWALANGSTRRFWELMRGEQEPVNRKAQETALRAEEETAGSIEVAKAAPKRINWLASAFSLKP